MTADIDAVLSRLRERPECRDAVEVIEELAGQTEFVRGLLRDARQGCEEARAERDRLREACFEASKRLYGSLARHRDLDLDLVSHRHLLGASTILNVALDAALGESPVPTGPADSHIRQGMRSLADEWRRREADRRAQVWNTAENAAAADAYDACADEVEDLLAAPSHPTGEPGGAT